MAKEREQIPLSFNMNDPIEKEIFFWLQQLRGKNKKGNLSAIIKKILFTYIDREKERDMVNKQWHLANMGSELKLTPVQPTLNQINPVDEDTEVDTDSLPF